MKALFKMRIKVIIFAIALLVSSAFTWNHPLKMSFSNLTIHSDGIIEIETRIFLDDLTAHLQEKYSLQQADFSTATSNGSQALERYLAHNLYFKQDGEKFSLWINALSFSKNEMALAVKLSTKQPLNTSKETTIVNTLLCDAFPTQVNFLRFSGKQYTMDCSNPKFKLIPKSNY